MVDKNENSPKKRSRLFGGFRSRQAAAPTASRDEPVAPTPPSDRPEAVDSASAAPIQENHAVTEQNGAPSSTDPADSTQPTDSTQSEGSTTLPVTQGAAVVDTEALLADEAAGEPTREDALPPVEKPASPFELPLTTTSLIFHAPEIAAVSDDYDYGDDDDDDDDAPSNRRRTRQRGGNERGGNDRGNSDRSGNDREGEPTNTRTRNRSLREPREPRERPEPELITEPQRIKGSTRLEAKKQRRRDGRDAGRRRPVVTEAEFLARRESVDRKMIVRASGDSIQIGVLEDGILAEHYVAKSQNVSLIGNVYLGRVQNVLPSMEAAFVDIGRGRNAVLYSGEVDWDSVEHGNQPRRIELALKPGDRVLVQVTKDPVGHKGARLTSQISLPGRFLVYVPNGSMNGISRKLPDTERARLKKILKEALPENTGVIVRTAAEGATEEQLTLDVKRLLNQWTDISQKVEAGAAPALLHSEPDLLIKIVRDVFNEDFQQIVVDGDESRETIETYLSAVAPDLLDRVTAYEGDKDAFDEYRLNEQIDKALDRKVWLPSGGSLIIDRTEAMTVVDVNTGKFVGSGGNLEETVTKNNIEAAEELVRQLRLRDIGGIIVVDFIDMVLETNRDLVLRRLVECLSRDRTKHQVAEVTSLGLIQMTRKKLGLGLMESFDEIGVDRQQAAEQQQQNRAKQQERRRGKAASTGPSKGSPAKGGPSGTHPVSAPHAITDDVKNALAQIAASTIPHAAEGESAPAAATAAAVEAAIDAIAAAAASAPGTETTAADTDAIASLPETAPAASGDDDTKTVQHAPSTGSERGRRGSRGGRRASSSAPVSTDATAGVIALDVPAVTTGAAAATKAVDETAPVSPPTEAPAAPTDTTLVEGSTARGRGRSSEPRRSSATVTAPEATVAILDIPVAPVQRIPRKISSEDAEQLLDSVLGALPEPKQPGQGRGRSRRASSAGTAAAPAPAPASAPDENEGESPEGSPFILGVGVSSDDL